MTQEQQEAWSETVVSEQEFIAAGQKLDAWETAADFLQLFADGCRPKVVFVTEGYLKQQHLALNFQLPDVEHIVDPDDLQPPPQLFWSVAANMLNPALLLGRELGGHGGGLLKQQWHRVACAQHERIAFGAVERCKLLDVQYILKQYMPQQQQGNDNPFREHEPQQPQQHIALTLRLTLQRLIDPQQQQQVKDLQRCLEARGLQQTASCNVHSSASPGHPGEPQPVQSAQYSKDAAIQRYMWDDQWACTCTLEYPVFQLEGNHYIVPAEEFDQGMETWSHLAPNDGFTMVWDGSPCEGFVEGYRQRQLDDPYWGSPWRSIIIDWKEDPVDRATAPEDWWHGNPWEMQRLPRKRPAAAAAVVPAPWTKEGAALAVAAKSALAAAEQHRQPARAAPKRKRERINCWDDEYYYDAGASDDASEPSEMSFFYDDDPDDYVIYASSRRHTQRQRQQRSMVAAGGSSSQRHSGSGAAAAAARQRSGEAGENDPAHNWGRDLVGVPPDVCIICRIGSERGELINMHTGKAQQNCCRRYHAGCLLLLNAAGLRTVYLGKQQVKQQHSARASSNAQSAVRAGAGPGSGLRNGDGLLGELQQLLHQPGTAVNARLAAAVAEAEATAALYQNGELSLTCPAHFCHGCGLNGKHEYLVWCCCCWVRTFHWRNCIPLGAEKVELGGREYIRCPFCVAANAPLPQQAPAAAAAPVRMVAADVRAHAAATTVEDVQATNIAAGHEAETAATAATTGMLKAVSAAAEAEVQAASEAGSPAVTPDTEDTAAATGLEAAAAAADAIQEELMQQQRLLLRTALGAPALSTLHDSNSQHMGQRQQQQDEGQRGELHQACNQQQLQPQQQVHDADGFGSHVHTPDAFCLVSDEPALHAVAASSRADMGGAGTATVAHSAAAAVNHSVPLLAILPSAASRVESKASGPACLLLMQETQELQLLARDIRSLQTQLQQKQQLYQQKLQQLEQRRHQLQQQQGHQLKPHAAVASAAVADVDAAVGAAAIDAVAATLQGAAVSANLPNADASLAMDIFTVGAEDGAEAAAGDAAVQREAAAAAVASAAQAPCVGNIAAMPSWLQLSLEDEELRSPSWRLVPVSADSAATEALRSVAQAITRLPHQQQLGPASSPSSVAGGGGQQASCDASAYGLPLSAPRCHWLIGSREKAEAAKYKVSGSWAGCPVIHVQTPDDGVFGVCLLVEHAARLTKIQQQQQQVDGVFGGAAPAAFNEKGLQQPAQHHRPDVFLRCWKPVAHNRGRPQQQQQQQRQQQRQAQNDGEERVNRRGLRGEEWVVLVNGVEYSCVSGRDGWKLQDGDVIAVQGLQLKLEAIR